MVRRHLVQFFAILSGQNDKILKNGPHFQIRHTKIDAGAKFHPNQRNMFFDQNLAILRGRNDKFFKNGPHFQILQWKIDLSAKFQPNLGNLFFEQNLAIFCHFWGVKITIFLKTDHIFKFGTQKLIRVQNFSQIRELVFRPKFWHFLPFLGSK